MRTAETVLSILGLFDKNEAALYRPNPLPIGPSGLRAADGVSRRDAIASGLAWFPFGRRNHVTMAGIRFRAIRNGSGTRSYLHIHGNEATARQVLSEHLSRVKGVGWFVESDRRLVDFRAGRIDPNRMFSSEGALTNLRRLNPEWNEARYINGVLKLEKERHKLLEPLLPKRGGLLFALHNNSEGYSVREEVAISDRTALNEPDRPHEFFLCTDPADFEVLAKSRYNVVLQNRTAPPDDGSLSRLCAKLGVRYVNLEVALGDAARQREMLEWADSRLR